MIQKICPYCDQVIGNGLYCSHCKSRLRPGQAQKIDFYLNQRHPKDDTGCDYHAPAFDTGYGTDSYAQPQSRSGLWGEAQPRTVGSSLSERANAAKRKPQETRGGAQEKKMRQAAQRMETGSYTGTENLTNAGYPAGQSAGKTAGKVQGQSSAGGAKPKKKDSGMFGGIVTLIIWITIINGLIESCSR